jgi:uncharacterized protein (TIGR03000 family)
LPADARLYVDGQLANLTSGTRAFSTPPLEPDRDYSYTITADATRDGETVSQSKRIIVRAGEATRVTFNELTAQKPAPARITVHLPADARLFVNGELAKLTSNTRSFETPRLKPGKEYTYTLKAELVREGQTRSANRQVVFQAGKHVTVDFGNLATVNVASR